MTKEYKKISDKMAEQFVNSVDNILYLSEKPLTFDEILEEYKKRGINMDEFSKEDLEELLATSCINSKKDVKQVRFIGDGRAGKRTYDNLPLNLEPNRNINLYKKFKLKTEEDYKRIKNNYLKVEEIFKRIVSNKDKLSKEFQEKYPDTELGVEIYLEKMRKIPPHKALLTMFTLINKSQMLSGKKNDIDLLIELNYIHNENYSRTKNIKDFIHKLEDHIEYADEKSVEFGEIMTKISCVRKIIGDCFQESDFQDPFLIWKDYAVGVGPFIIVLIEKLMEGLKYYNKDGLDLTDEEYRYRYILENMIYAFELQDENSFIYWMAINPHCEYNLNLKSDSYLDKTFEESFPDYNRNIREINGTRGLCNPPYNTASNSANKDRDQGSRKIWMDFVEKSMKEDDYAAFITPNNFLSKSCAVHELIKEHVVYANIDSDNIKKAYFNGVGSTFAYYLLSKEPPKEPPVFQINSETKVNYNILDMPILPLKNISPITYDIFNKIINSGYKPLTFKRSDDKPDDVYWNRDLLNVNTDLFISINRAKTASFNEYENDVKKTSSYWYECSSKEEKDILMFNLNTPLYKFIINSIRSGAAIISTINSVPIINEKFNTEEELYAKIGLTEEEISYIKPKEKNKSKKNK